VIRGGVPVGRADDGTGPVVLRQRRFDRDPGDVGQLGVGEGEALVERVRVRPVAGGDGEHRVAVAEVAADGGLVGPVLRPVTVERVDEHDEQLQAGPGPQVLEGGLGLGPPVAEHAGPVGQLAVEAQRIVGPGRGRRGEEGQGGGGEPEGEATETHGPRLRARRRIARRDARPPRDVGRPVAGRREGAAWWRTRRSPDGDDATSVSHA
jgi:hypothetical protein